MKCLKCGVELGVDEKICHICGEFVGNIDIPKVLEPEIIDVPKVTEPEIIGMETISYKQPEVEILGFEDINKSDKFFKKSVLIGAIVSCLVIVLAVVGAFMLFSTSPKEVFMVPINAFFDETIKKIDVDYRSVKGSASIKLESNTKVLDMFSNLSLDVKYGIDYEKMLMSMDYSSSYDNEKLVSGKLYAENNNFYAYVEEVFSKYFKIPVEEQEFKQIFSSGNDSKEVKVILSRVQSALNDVLKDDYFTKEKETIIIDGEEVKVNKSILTLNDANMRIIAKEFLNLLRDDQEFVSSFGKLSDMSEVEVKSSIEEAIEEIDKSDVTTDEATIVIYTKGFNHEFVKLEIVNVIDGKNEVFEVIEKADNNYDYVISVDNENISGNVEIIENSDSKISFKAVATNGNDTYILTVSSDFQYNVNVDKLDVSNSVTLEELTEEDSNEIITNLMNHELFQSIFGMIMGDMTEEY